MAERTRNEYTLDWLIQCAATIPWLPVSGIQSHTVGTANFSLWTNPTLFWVGTFHLLLERKELYFSMTHPQLPLLEAWLSKCSFLVNFPSLSRNCLAALCPSPVLLYFILLRPSASITIKLLMFPYLWFAQEWLTAILCTKSLRWRPISGSLSSAHNPYVRS